MMAQPLQHQHPARILFVEPSRFFTPGTAYPVIEWRDGVPKVRNDSGSLTWLVERRCWTPAPEMTLARSHDLLHARYRAERARGEG